MTINIGNNTGYKAYGMSRHQEEALVARQTRSEERHVEIAKNSNGRLVLHNLALNENLSEDAVQALFDRDQKSLTSRLENMGYKRDSVVDNLLEFFGVEK